MKCLARQLKNQSGFTLVEVLISIFILSIIITSASVAFVYAIRVTQDNKYNMTSINLANQTVEYIRSLQFVDVGTIGGDPIGILEQNRIENVDGVNYKINTLIIWEEEGDWATLGNAEWDYKSVKISVVPQRMEGDQSLTKVIETFVTRDSAQPPITGGNIRIRIIRGWNTVPGAKIPVPNVKVMLTTGPSAPRQVQTSTKGAVRFLDLSPGNYTVNIDPSSLGMIVQPDLATLPYTITNYITKTDDYKVEYPCQLRIKLKDYEGNPISLNSSTSGNILVQVPYGTNVSKNFTSSEIDSQGNLPQGFITGLWPVGDGYSGVYSITNVLIPGYLYFGSYEISGSGEVLWNGKFNGPGTDKEIICYFRSFPITPSGISTSWVSGTNIITGSNTAKDEDDNTLEGKFNSSDLTERITMPYNTISNFNASTIYFENTGSTSTPGLYINNRSNLILHTGTVVFRGKVEIKNSSNPYNIGKITFRTTYEDGISAPIVEGSTIGGTPGVNYGRLYLTKAIVLGGSTIVEPGGYYFYNGLVLPNNAPGLIPITMDNYID